MRIKEEYLHPSCLNDPFYDSEVTQMVFNKKTIAVIVVCSLISHCGTKVDEGLTIHSYIHCTSHVPSRVSLCLN